MRFYFLILASQSLVLRSEFYFLISFQISDVLLQSIINVVGVNTFARIASWSFSTLFIVEPAIGRQRGYSVSFEGDCAALTNHQCPRVACPRPLRTPSPPSGAIALHTAHHCLGCRCAPWQGRSLAPPSSAWWTSR